MTSSNPKIVACVLRSGGVYNVDYVNRLANSVARNLTIDYKFVCLSDLSDGFNENVHEVIALNQQFPGWWSKIELFRFDLYQNLQWFFLDLDTVIIGNIDDVVGANHNGLTALEDFNFPNKLGSGLLAWQQGEYNYLYSDFIDSVVRNPNEMNRYSEGDQAFIQESVSYYDTFQRRFPGKVVSFKKHCIRSATDITVPVEASIICFHGTPKPHELKLITIVNNWK